MTGFQQSKESEITCEHSGVQLNLKKIYILKEMRPLLIPVNDNSVGFFITRNGRDSSKSGTVYLFVLFFQL